MASVMHLIYDAEQIKWEIVGRNKEIDLVRHEYYVAALKIQTAWRAHCQRRIECIRNTAAIVIQKWIRRYLVLSRLPATMKDYVEHRLKTYYDTAATKIQAVYKGYRVRKTVINFHNIFIWRKLNETANDGIIEQIKEAQKKAEEEEMKSNDEDARMWVLYIAFKLHHLLRTETKESVCSLHGKRQLSAFEKVMKSLTFYRYMKNIRKEYEALAFVKAPIKKVFQGRYAKCEKYYRERDRSREIREEKVIDKCIHSKPFNLFTKVPPKKYQPVALYKCKYELPITEICRDINPSKNISPKNFDLDVKHLNLVDENKPYHIDFWGKEPCTIHNCPSI